MEIIASEDFKVTQAIRDAITSDMEGIKKYTHTEPYIHVYLCKEGKDEFSVKLVINHKGKDIVAQKVGRNLYHEVKEAKRALVRQIVETERIRKNS